jgi:hypothetical protein
MGRLKFSRANIKVSKKLIKPWLIPALTALLLIFGFQYVFHKQEKSEFSSAVQNSNLRVGTETKQGYQQVYYEYKDKKFFVTDDTLNHTNPYIHRQHIVWVEHVYGADQVILFDILSQVTTRLSYSGSNANPVVYEGMVAWEKLQSGKPQIYFFDGQTVEQISKEHPSIRPVISKDSIAYAQQAATEWRVIQRSIIGITDKIVARGSENDAWPHFVGDELRTTYADYSRWKIGNVD